MDILKKVKTHAIVDAILSLIIGLIFVIDPVGSSNTVVIIVGCFMVASGIADVVRYFTTTGFHYFFRGSLFTALLKIVLGAFTMTHVDTMLTLFAYIFSIYVIVTSANTFEMSIQLKRANISGWFLNMLLSILVMIAGVVMLFVPFSATTTAAYMMGIILISEAVITLYTTFRISKISKEFIETLK